MKGNRFSATGMPLRPLIMQVYNLRDFQILGGPDWVNTDQSLFSAVEQLGLKLQPAKGPVEVLVIDSVQKPLEN